MKYVDPSIVLELIESYEAISRSQLIQNLYGTFADSGISRKSVYSWLADLLGTTRNTTYSWFAPNRDAKIPLKALLQVSICLKTPIYEMLDITAKNCSVAIRQKKNRPSFETAVSDYCRDHPGASVREIASALGITNGTARRHLLHLEAESKYNKGESI